jgi:large subunit ribosomal protein L22
VTGAKTNERPGTRAVLRHTRIAPNKVREVLDLVRGKPVHEAEDILRFCERDAALVVGKVLHSAVANAENNDEQDPEELYVSACYADEGTTMKRWRPRARGRATRIRKRTSHITVIVSRMPQAELERLLARRRAERLAQRARRVAGARKAAGDTRSRAQRRRGEAIEAPEEAAAADTSEAEAAAAGTSEAEAAAADTSEAEAAAADTSEAEAAPAPAAAGETAAGEEATAPVEDAAEEPEVEPTAADTPAEESGSKPRGEPEERDSE